MKIISTIKYLSILLWILLPSCKKDNSISPHAEKHIYGHVTARGSDQAVPYAIINVTECRDGVGQAGWKEVCYTDTTFVADKHGYFDVTLPGLARGDRARWVISCEIDDSQGIFGYYTCSSNTSAWLHEFESLEANIELCTNAWFRMIAIDTVYDDIGPRLFSIRGGGAHDVMFFGDLGGTGNRERVFHVYGGGGLDFVVGWVTMPYKFAPPEERTQFLDTIRLPIYDTITYTFYY